MPVSIVGESIPVELTPNGVVYTENPHRFVHKKYLGKKAQPPPPENIERPAALYYKVVRPPAVLPNGKHNWKEAVVMREGPVNGATPTTPVRCSCKIGEGNGDGGENTGLPCPNNILFVQGMCAFHLRAKYGLEVKKGDYGFSLYAVQPETVTYTSEKRRHISTRTRADTKGGPPNPQAILAPYGGDVMTSTQLSEMYDYTTDKGAPVICTAPYAVEIPGTDRVVNADLNRGPAAYADHYKGYKTKAEGKKDPRLPQNTELKFVGQTPVLAGYKQTFRFGDPALVNYGEGYFQTVGADRLVFATVLYRTQAELEENMEAALEEASAANYKHVYDQRNAVLPELPLSGDHVEYTVQCAKVSKKNKSRGKKRKRSSR